MKDQPKHVWYCQSYSKHFRVVKQAQEKGERKKKRGEKKSFLAIKKYLNEIWLILIVFRGNHQV